ncbi:hypothetical protein [Variovorax sp. E3]|uniref:hypothetical protein n=1 Tax=Variovorax sp. E3 TaxID=1914993 RepID=UPI0018DEADCF|nr:hypothetical protein [Variovorax sp. E3]
MNDIAKRCPMRLMLPVYMGGTMFALFEPGLRELHRKAGSATAIHLVFILYQEPFNWHFMPCACCADAIQISARATRALRYPITVRAEVEVSHRVDWVGSQGWKPTLRSAAVDKRISCIVRCPPDIDDGVA